MPNPGTIPSFRVKTSYVPAFHAGQRLFDRVFFSLERVVLAGKRGIAATDTIAIAFCIRDITGQWGF